MSQLHSNRTAAPNKEQGNILHELINLRLIAWQIAASLLVPKISLILRIIMLYHIIISHVRGVVKVTFQAHKKNVL